MEGADAELFGAEGLDTLDGGLSCAEGGEQRDPITHSGGADLCAFFVSDLSERSVEDQGDFAGLDQFDDVGATLTDFVDAFDR